MPFSDEQVVIIRMIRDIEGLERFASRDGD